MLVADYNSGTLIVFLAAEKPDSVVETKDNIIRISKEGKTLAYHFTDLSFSKPGPVTLDSDTIKKLNQKLTDAGFEAELSPDLQPKFVIGLVQSIEKHPNSDHLAIAQVAISKDKSIQIVSGSPNLRTNVKTVVCLSGAILPSGKIIWPGQLRSVDSQAMMAAPRELGLKNAPDHPGMIILPDDFGNVGDPLDFNRANELEFD